jgi:hypothetical protein
LSGNVFLQKLALVTVESPTALWLDSIDRAEKLPRSVIFKQKWAEPLVSTTITIKIEKPPLRGFEAPSEFRRSASDLAATPTVVAP